MKRMVKFFILCLVIAGLIVVPCYLILTNSYVLTKLVSFWFNKAFSQYQISHLSIKEQSYRFPLHLLLNQVSFYLAKPENLYTVNIQRVELQPHGEKGDPLKAWHIQVNDFNIESESLDLHEGNLDFFLSGIGREKRIVKGDFLVDMLKWGIGEIGDIRSSFSSDGREFKIGPLDAVFYGGHLKGDLAVNLSDSSYIMDVDVDHSYLEQLGQLAPLMTGKLKGQMDGSMKIRGNPQGITQMRGTFVSPEGCFIHPSVLQYLSEHIPNDQQKEFLQPILAQQEQVLFEQASVDLMTLTQERLSAHFDLKSLRLNFQAKLKIDFYVEGGLQQIWNQLGRMGES